MMFVNLPVKDAKRARDFWKALGYEHNPQFSSDDTTCVPLGPSNFVMLLEDKRFKEFLPHKDIADTRKTSEALVALSLDSREAVDRMVETAVKNGGRKYKEPQDLGFMYGWGFEDPDGHIWEPFWMNPAGPSG